MSDKDNLRKAIAEEEARIARIEKERAEALANLNKLKDRLTEEVSASTPLYSVPSDTLPFPYKIPSAAEEKVALFRSLFRGREDVFPRLWENAKTGRKGYAPACSNEWVGGVCRKPLVKCGSCSHRAFLPVTDQVVLDHLQGRHVIGVYPLLPDETCFFLAADFDGPSWQEDVAAFAATCHRIGVPPAIERSRSGKGAHTWFFFSSPVPASVARQLGCYLLTETMSGRHQLAMSSYDRLFPNQDTMPSGGFGNLIALPLQHKPRKDGNTVFIDDNFEAYPDQWAYLAAISRLSAETVHAVADEAWRTDKVIGVPLAISEDDQVTKPWTRPPSRKPAALPIEGELPTEVRAVLSQRLFVEKAGLPSPVLARIKRLAAFQNPEFYKKQKMRLSTATTPRVVCCAEDLPDYIALPRGCRDDLSDLLAGHNIPLAIEDKRNEGSPIEFRFQGRLTAMQHEAAKALLSHDNGVFVAPPGAGKTVVGAYLTAARGRNTLVLVHRKPILDQWVARLSSFLGVEPKEIGRIGGGKNSLTGRLDVAMIQSLVRKGEVSDIVAGYGHVIVDECHHLPAVSFERVLSEVKARFVTGLTATPYRRDGHQPIIHMQLGPVRFAVSRRGRAEERTFEQLLIVRETDFDTGRLGPDAGIQEIYAALAADEDRNMLIFDDVLKALEEGRSPILLTERKDHLDHLAEKFRKFTRHMVVLKGGMTTRERTNAMAHIATIPDSEERLVLATGRYIGEGFDDVRLDTLFLALPVSWKGTLVQYAGRLHRQRPEKTEVRIYDYVDRSVPVLAKMFDRRMRGYRALEYFIGTSSPKLR
ncbi:MAG: TOTE conflict system archaeo-eukaryotic primase domain-containing protein [Candidatus Nanopelagicales bacterium]